MHGTIRFQCPGRDCGNDIWEDVDASSAAPEVLPFTCLSCDQITHVSISVQDYSIHAELLDSAGYVSVAMPEDAEYGQYDRLVPSDDPAAEFFTAVEMLLELIDESKDIGHMMPQNRMIFSQLVAVLEAYLSDTFLQLLVVPGIKAKIRERALELKEVNSDLVAALLDPVKADEALRKAVQKQIFHNLEPVRGLYRAATGRGFAPDVNIVLSLYRAVGERHDCVHRNGKTKDGRMLEFEGSKIRALATLATQVVNHVEASVAQARVEVGYIASDPAF
jgi:hypothetical protein